MPDRLHPMPAGTYGSSVTTYAKASRVITNSLITSWASSQTDIENQVFNTNVGNSIHMDALDTTIINNYVNVEGNLTTPSIPIKQTTQRPDDYDSDKDGMSDVWERSIFGDLSKTANGDQDGDGYTNIEAFLFSLTVE